MQDAENGQERVWRVQRNANSIYESDELLDVGSFPTFESANEERERLKQRPEFLGVKLSIIPDPPMPHGQTNLDGI